MSVNSNPISIILTESSLVSGVIDISSNRLSNKGDYFIPSHKVGFTFAGFTGAESVYFEKYVSDNTGWQPITTGPTNMATVWTVSNNGSSPVLDFGSIPKLKIIATGIVAPVEIKIDLSY